MSAKAPAPEILQQISAAVAARQYPQAQQLARNALEAGAEHPKLLHLRAIWLEERGQLTEALQDLERAHALNPRELGVLMALGNLLERMNQRVVARDAFDLAVKLRPDLVGPWVRLGWAAENLGEIEEARSAYHEAITLDPQHAQALGRLALIASQQGDWDDARRWADRALAANPREFSADLAYVRADIRAGRLPEAERRLMRLLTAPLSPDDVYLGRKELGALRHQQKRYREAFDAWATGNEAVYGHYAQAFAPRRVADMTATLDDYFAAEAPWPSVAPGPSPASTHVFLLGFARSGTTLLEQVLAGHPDVISLEEKDTLGAAIATFPATRSGLDALRTPDPEVLARLRAAYWRQVESFGVNPSGKVLIDKFPFNAAWLAHIARLFPDAKVLFALRDPRDVILSCFRTPFRINGIVYELLRIEDAGRFYAAYMRAAHHIRRVAPTACIDVRHENLLDDIEGEVRRVCDFIGIDLYPEMLAFEASQRKVATPSAHQLREGLTRARAGQWVHYAEELQPAIEHLAPWIERFSYQR